MKNLLTFLLICEGVLGIWPFGPEDQPVLIPETLKAAITTSSTTKVQVLSSVEIEYETEVFSPEATSIVMSPATVMTKTYFSAHVPASPAVSCPIPATPMPTVATCPEFSLPSIAAFNISATDARIYNLTDPMNRNTTMIFKLDQSQADYFEARRFCQARGPGLHCYRPVGCNNCLPGALLSCPDVVFLRCHEHFVCLQDEASNQGQCLAMMDILPSEAWQNGEPRVIVQAASKLGFAITTAANSVATVMPDLCMAPMPLQLEHCRRNATEGGKIRTTKEGRISALPVPTPLSVYAPSVTSTPSCLVQ